MRILLTMTGSWGTGSGTVVEALVRGFAARGHAVCVLHPENRAVDGSLADNSDRAPQAEHVVWPFPVEENGVVLPHFPLMIPDPNPRAPHDAQTYAALTDAQCDLFIRAFGERLGAAVEAFRPDVIETQHVWLMADVIRKTGLPYVAAAHHSDQMAYRQDARTAPFARRAARGAERIVALLEPGKREIVELYGVPPERVEVLGNGYDRTAFFPAHVDRAALLSAHGLEIPAGAPLVTFAGKLSKTKGIDVLMEANRLLRGRLDAPPHFIVFGTGRLATALDGDKDAAGDYARDGFHLMGHQSYETVRDFHNAARLSVMPSRSEGFGLAALEAMGCALPVVCSRLGGLDTLTVGANAEPGDAASLADAIASVLTLAAPDYAAMRAHAQRVAETFSWDEIVERRLAIYETLPRIWHAERASADEVVALRTAVLRPGQTTPAAFAEDDDAIHVAVRKADAFGQSVVGVATAYPEAPPAALRGAIPQTAFAPGAAFRFRGMASAESVRGQGVGAAVLRGVFREARGAGGSVVWCNARTGAAGFYERMGMAAVGDPFDIPGIGPHVVMWRAV